MNFVKINLCNFYCKKKKIPLPLSTIIYKLADPWRYAAISIESVAYNCGDLFNDRGISKEPEKNA